MADSPSNVEPLVSQLPTSELKRILSERFAQQVVVEARQKIWRPLTLFGLPGIVLGGTLLWALLSQLVNTTVTTSVASAQDRLRTSLNENMALLLDVRTNTLRGEVNKLVTDSFQGQHGVALQNALGKATEEQRFRDQLQEIVNREIGQAWAQRRDALRTSFLVEIARDHQFLETFSGHVEKAMATQGNVTRILTGALEQSIRQTRYNDTRRTAALALLAAVEQDRANRVVRDILDRRGDKEEREAALRALDSVNFSRQQTSDDGLLRKVLTLWSEYCGITRCAPEHRSTLAVAAFLERGASLDDTGRAAWIATLREWHENLVAGETPGRAASLDLVPGALGSIGTPQARNILTGWFTAAEPDLALPAATAVAAMPAETLADDDRIALFRELWPRIVTDETRQAALAEAAWMALGAVSRGDANSGGLFRGEATLVRALPAGMPANTDLVTWANSRPDGLRRLRSREAVPVALDTPCTALRQATGTADNTSNEARLRVNVCALQALIRPQNGDREWNQLRHAARWNEQDIATLGLLWAVAASRTADDEIAAPRLAPVADLLMSRVPSPASFQLTAMMILRTVPVRPAWEALEPMRLSPGDARLFLSAAQWAFRRGADGHAWFSDRLQAMPMPMREAVLREIAAAALDLAETPALPDALDGLARSLVAPQSPGGPNLPPVRLASSLAARFNSLRFMHTVAPHAVLVAIERNDGFRALQRFAEGTVRVIGVRASDAAAFHAALLLQAGWDRAHGAAIPLPPGRGSSVTLLPAHEGRFGRVRLQDREFLTIERADAAKATEPLAPVTFFNPTTKQIRVLDQGASWTIRNGKTGDAEDWLFRLPADAPELRMSTIKTEPLSPPPSLAAAAVVTFRSGQIYDVETQKSGQSQNWQGYVRFDGLVPGQRIRITTFDLDEAVDTVIAIMDDQSVVGEDDDGGEDLASTLIGTADRRGSVLLRLGNIGRDGLFRLRIDRLN